MEAAKQTSACRILRRIRWVLSSFMVCLVVSGVTAFPLLHEMNLLVKIRGLDQVSGAEALGGFDQCILKVRNGLQDTYARHPWIAYGTDWLAFAHVAIAVFFIGCLFDPVRNIWVLKAGLIACAMIIPLALICGEVRQIPLAWRMIDCSFGIVGAIPLFYCIRLVRRLESFAPVQRAGTQVTAPSQEL